MVTELARLNARLFDFGLSFSNTGCYIIIDLIRRMPKLNLLKAVLLFPTVEHIWDTPNGKTLGNMVVYLRWALVALFHVNYYVSDWVKWRLLQWWFKGRKVSWDFCFLSSFIDLLIFFLYSFIHSFIHLSTLLFMFEGKKRELKCKAIGGFEWIFINLFKSVALSKVSKRQKTTSNLLRINLKGRVRFTNKWTLERAMYINLW